MFLAWLYEEIAQPHVFTDFALLLFSVTVLNYTKQSHLSYITEQLSGLSAGEREAFSCLLMVPVSPKSYN